MRKLTQIIDAVEAELAGGPPAELTEEENATLARACDWIYGHMDCPEEG